MWHTHTHTRTAQFCLQRTLLLRIWQAWLIVDLIAITFGDLETNGMRGAITSRELSAFSHFTELDEVSRSIGSLDLIALRLGRDSHRERASREWVTGRNGTERHVAAWRGALRFFFSRSSSRARDSREVRAESDGGRLNVMCLFLRRRYSHGQLPQTLACVHARAYVIWTYVLRRARVLLTRLADVRHNSLEIRRDRSPSGEYGRGNKNLAARICTNYAVFRFVTRQVKLI